MQGRCPFASRRGLLAGGLAGGLAGLVGAAAQAAQPAAPPDERAAKGITPASQGDGRNETVPFHGTWQAGILTATQNHTVFAAFDLVAGTRAEVAALMAEWTTAAERMSRGQPAGPPTADRMVPPTDSGEARALPPRA